MKIEKLQSAIWAEIEAAPFRPNVESIRDNINKFLEGENIGVAAVGPVSSSTMHAEHFGQVQTERDYFLDLLTQKQDFLFPKLTGAGSDIPADMVRIEDIERSEDIVRLVRDILEDYRRETYR